MYLNETILLENSVTSSTIRGEENALEQSGFGVSAGGCWLLFVGVRVLFTFELGALFFIDQMLAAESICVFGLLCGQRAYSNRPTELQDQAWSMFQTPRHTPPLYLIRLCPVWL